MKTEFLDLLLLLHSLLVDGATQPRAGTLGAVLILPLPRLLQKGTAESRVVLLAFWTTAPSWCPGSGL